MSGIVLTRSNQTLGDGSADAFETIVADFGSVTAVGSDVLVLSGGNAVEVSASGSPKSLTIDVIPSEISLDDLGDVDVASVNDGYTLVYRTGSPSGWVAEPSVSSDEFVKASGTDTTAGYLTNKLQAGSGIDFNTLNSGGNEVIEISVSDTLDAYSTISDGSNTSTAGDHQSTIEFQGSDAITVTVGETGSPPKSTVTVGIDGNLQMSVINSQPMLTYFDTNRTKRLTVSEQSLVFSESQLDAEQWLEIGNAVDAESGYIADYAGTVVSATAHCENANSNAKDIHLFINGVDVGSIGTLLGGANVTFINNTLDTDFARGAKIRLQAQQNSGGAIQDTVVKLTVKWRG